MEELKVNLDNTYWDRVRGYVTDLRVDSRWVLRKKGDERSYGSLRIVSHPDLRPGYLRAIFIYVISMRNKTGAEKVQTLEDYQIDAEDLEAYSIDNNIKTETKIYEATNRELCELFGVKIF